MLSCLPFGNTGHYFLILPVGYDYKPNAAQNCSKGLQEY